MTAPKRPRPPPPRPVTPEHAAEIVRTQVRLRAEREARRKAVLDGWVAPASKPRSQRDRELRDLALFLLAEPDLISSPLNAPALFEILQKFVADTPPRMLSSEEIANLVDRCIDEGGISLTDARRHVAEATIKTPGAVKRAHLRHGIKRKV